MSPDKIFLSLLAALVLISSPAEAKEVSYGKSWKLKKRAQEIVEVLTDYARYCDSGCKYRYPSVKQTLILPYQRTDSSFYVWTFVEDIKNSEWFSRVTVRKKGSRTVVQFTMITDKRTKKLERLSGKPHDPVFDTCVTRYQIVEVFHQGRFLRSELTFRARVTVSGLISLFSGAIRSGLEETGKAIVDNIRKSGGKKPAQKVKR